MSRWWLVELEDDLAALYTTRSGVWASVHSVNGVKRTTDMDVLSCRSLKDLGVPLLDDEVSLVKKKRER